MQAITIKFIYIVYFANFASIAANLYFTYLNNKVRKKLLAFAEELVTHEQKRILRHVGIVQMIDANKITELFKGEPCKKK